MHTLAHSPPETRPMTREDFSLLIRENHGPLMAYARMITGDAAKAGEIVQDSFITAWQNIGKFDVTRDVACWLRGIVRNKWREACRRSGREVVMDEESLAALEQAVTSWQADRPEIFDRLATCREHLPVPFAECVRLSYDEKLTSDEAAVRLGISSSTLRKRLERARTALRLCLQQSPSNLS
jgi:RNA polymerase sigma factor CnrH